MELILNLFFNSVSVISSTLLLGVSVPVISVGTSALNDVLSFLLLFPVVSCAAVDPAVAAVLAESPVAAAPSAVRVHLLLVFFQYIWDP